MTPTPEMIEAGMNLTLSSVDLPASECLHESDVREIQAAALALLPGEPVAWEVAETLPSGTRRWQVVEHENHARKLAAKLEADVRPLYVAPAPLPVAVKALEWVQNAYDYEIYSAKSVVGFYTVQKVGKWEFLPTFGPGKSGFDNDDQAKAAAQADYEARIRSALSSPASPGYCTDCESQTTIVNGRCSCGSGRVVSTPASDIAGLREENERLREALRPFSAEADHYRDSAGGVLIESGMGDVRDAEYNISDLRRARTLVHSALQHVAKGERG